MGNFPHHDKFAFNIARKPSFVHHHPKSLALNLQRSKLRENQIKKSHFPSQVHQLFEVHKISDVVGAINFDPPFFM